MSEMMSDGKITPPTRAIGFGPNAGGSFSQEDYHHPAAGWGAAKSVGLVLLRQHELIDGTRAVLNMNHENGGYDCPGCAWPDDRKGLRLDICENGIKHATWEMTRKRVTRDFFAAHTVTELTDWTDFALEDAGRLTEPMRYDAATDKYVPVSWDDGLRACSAGTSAACWQPKPGGVLHVRPVEERSDLPCTNCSRWELGTNNLPDCSNMCHEASGPGNVRRASGPARERSIWWIGRKPTA